MRYGILLLGDRVAPRCLVSDGLLLASTSGDRLRSVRRVRLDEQEWPDLHHLLTQHGVEVLVCGGIRRDLKQAMLLNDIHVIDNVAATSDEALTALEEGALHSGLGLSGPCAGQMEREAWRRTPAEATVSASESDRAEGGANGKVDCLACKSRTCLLGRACEFSVEGDNARLPGDERQMVEAAMDINAEEDRILCRISELVYYCLEMQYQRIGVAFCIEMIDQTEVLVRLLRRFFEVHPVCCKVGGILHDEGSSIEPEPSRFQQVACNPYGQARVLGAAGTDLNVMVGLCMGMDCLFSQASEAPVTSLFVRDRSLANNPIAAIYSEYHLDEVSRVPATHGPIPAKGERQ